MARISIIVEGVPQPGGSKRGIYSKRLGRVLIFDDAKGNKDWRATVAAFAREAYRGEPLKGPLSVTMVFTMPRLKSHYNKRGLRLDAPSFHPKKPDVLKLARSTEDALTGILWVDDAQIAEEHISKVYGDEPGAIITVEELT